ncbi:hypothetical protein COLO4_05647 [Corchorus olitorius]|uniref:Protein PHYTOCHROME KINASE SUBSTRATE 4 n=1 Tax=Corchorus olitorius TaxID=93759 RepID=A0A1R3KQ95_9ROSI|nr:hypothetical protein COLO4_05647 [Corchorus olitorius]
MESRVGVCAEDQETEEISIFDAERYFNESNGDGSRVYKRVSPINVISRISSDGCCDVSRFSSASSEYGYGYGYGYGIGGGRNYRVGSFHATPTASSEASWNSQTGLLSNPPGAIAVSMTCKNRTNIDHDKKKGAGAGAGAGSGSGSGSGSSGSGKPKIKCKWLNWGRRCPCSCSGKKSVQVDPKTTPTSISILKNHKLKLDLELEDHKSTIPLPCNQYPLPKPRPNLMMINNNASASAAAGFTFPILNQHDPIPTSTSIQVDPARDSLEVFRPSQSHHHIHDPSSSFSVSVSKKLTSRIINTIITDDDVASDTSSDLFEIESFSTSTQSQTQTQNQTQTQTTPYQFYHRRDSLDEASSNSSSTALNARRAIIALAAPTNANGNGSSSASASGFMGCPYSPMTMTECYEPSEASIDWSVTTAEGFERGSVGVSEAEEAMAVVISGAGKKKSGGGLLSCRCEKAVSVVGPVKYVPPHPHGHAQAPPTSKHVVANVNNPPLARLSLPFAA